MLRTNYKNGELWDGAVVNRFAGEINDARTAADYARAVADAANAKASRRKVFLVDQYPGADATGATPSDAAVAAAIADMGSAGGIIEFGIGRYRLNSTKELSRAGQFFKGQGIGLTTIDFRGTGPTFRIWDSTTNPDGNHAPGRGGGVLGGMTIDGISNTNPSSVGLMLGDLVNATVERVRIVGFIQPNAIGFLLSNRYGWTEYGNFDVQVDYCSNCFVIEGQPEHPRPYGGTTSFSYNVFNFGFSAEANQNGVIVRGAVAAVGVKWSMKFNCNPGTTNSGVMFTIGSDAHVVLPPNTPRSVIKSHEYNHIEAEMDWAGETTNPGDVGHVDFMFGPFSSIRGSGSCILNDFSAPFRPGNTLAWDYKFIFSGRLDSASFGHYARFEMGFVSIGDPGRFGAIGDNGRYLLFQEGDGPAQTFPVIQPKTAVVERTWDPVNEVNIEDDVSIGIVLQSRLSTTETKKSLITLDGVNVVEALSGLGVNCRFEGQYADWAYQPLATLEPDGETNSSSLLISGRFGGFEPIKIGLWNIILANRSADFEGNTVSASISGMGDLWSTSDIWKVCDIVGYKQPDKSTKFYLKLKGFYVYDMIVRANKGTVDWDSSIIIEQLYGDEPDTVPTGELIWTLSEDDQFNRATPQVVEQSVQYDNEFRAAQGNFYVSSSLPENAFQLFYGATSFGAGQPIYFNNNRLQDVGEPTGWGDAATLGWVTDKVNANIPWGPTADGTKGQFAFDDTHFYVCTDTNTWRRVNLSSWVA